MEEEIPSMKVDLSDEFLNDIDEDTKVNDLDLKEQCRVVVNKTQRYIEELFRQKRKMKKMELFVKKKKGELFEYYKTSYEIKLTSTTDIMIFVERDNKYQKAKGLYDDLEVIVDFLEKTIKNMNNKSFILQKLVEMEKIGM